MYTLYIVFIYFNTFKWCPGADSSSWPRGKVRVRYALYCVSKPQIKRKFLVMIRSAVPVRGPQSGGYLTRMLVMGRGVEDREPRIADRGACALEQGLETWVGRFIGRAFCLLSFSLIT